MAQNGLEFFICVDTPFHGDFLPQALFLFSYSLFCMVPFSSSLSTALLLYLSWRYQLFAL